MMNNQKIKPDHLQRTAYIYLAVGTPVTQRPPHSPGRAVFPHPVLRLDSLPRGSSQLPVTRSSCYSPQ